MRISCLKKVNHHNNRHLFIHFSSTLLDNQASSCRTYFVVKLRGNPLSKVLVYTLVNIVARSEKECKQF